MIPTVAVPQEPKASTVQPSQNYLPTVMPGLLGDNGLIATCLAVIGTLFFLRKKYFQDGADIAKGKAEVAFIDTLVQQAEQYKEDARKAWGQRTRDAQQIAHQQAQIAHLHETLKVMQSILEEVAPEKAKLFESLKPAASFGDSLQFLER